jgi:hypothetical protein
MGRFHHVVLNIGPETVLWPENRGQRHAFRGRDAVNDVTELVVNRGVVAGNADSGAFQSVRREEPVRSETDTYGHP